MKKIIFCVTNDLTYDRRMIRICNALAQSGFEVTLVGRKLFNSLPTEIQPFKQYRLQCFINKGFLFYFEYNIRLLLYLLFSKTDIIGSIDDDTLLACGLAKKIKGCKLTFDAHEYFTEVPELEGKKIKKMIWSTLEKWIVPSTDICYTVSQSIAEIYTQKYHKNFALIRNCPTKIDFIRHTNFNNKIIIYQGAINLGRGLEELIDAMEFVEAQLWIIGEGDKSNTLRKLAQQKPYAQKLIFKGYIIPAELNQLTAQATVGYNVLKDMGLSYQYSLSNKFFDYIQNGIPSVSSSFIEYQNIIKEHPVGLMCECEPQSIAGAINQLLTDATIYNKCVSACEEAANIYHWELEKLKLIALYEHL